MRFRIVGLSVLVAVVAAGPAAATIPPQRNGRLPKAFVDQVKRDPDSMMPKRAFRALAQRVRETRMRLLSGQMSPEDAGRAGGTAFKGKKQIAALPLKFKDTPAGDPVSVATLQKTLFDGPSPTGTLTQYYREVSYGKFVVTGKVSAWRTVDGDAAHYAGSCQGLCQEAPIAEMVKARLDAEPGMNWSAYDNDGPDDKPNSADDDGYVDFVVFIQPDRGGECREADDNTIWSHQGNLTAHGGTEYVTKTKRPDGSFIKIDGYVVSAARACDRTSVNAIGVLTHELGHALDLPDLYDLDKSNGESLGVGVWCLMGLGGWGGDWNSPARPTHLGAWAKIRLGWETPDLIVAERKPAHFLAAETSPAAYQIRINADEYYLLENRQRTGFDTGAPGSGLIVWKINERVLDEQLKNNNVNGDETHKGVQLVEADGLDNLNFLEVLCTGAPQAGCGNAGDAGDPFPGSGGATAFDSASQPAAAGRAAICHIGISQSTMTADVLFDKACQAQDTALLGVSGAHAVQPAPPSQPDSPEDLPLISLEEVVLHPEVWMNKKVRVSGVLENVGTSYFRDRRLVLVGESKRAVPVRSVNVPIEAAPKQSGKEKGEPTTLAAYLGKSVDAIAVIEPADGTGEKVTLRLQDVRLAPTSSVR